MMPDLEIYAATVLGAFGATLGLLGTLIAVTVWQGGRARVRLARAEAAFGSPAPERPFHG